MNISKCKCGGNAIIRQDHFSVSYGDWKIFCEKCGMQTGWTKNKEDAIEIWNRTMSERTAKVLNITHVRGYPPDGVCGNCGFDVIDDGEYCPGCGAKLDWSGNE